MSPSPATYNRVAKLLHWLIGLGILGMLGLGWIMGEMEKGPGRIAAYQAHKAIGITILALVLVRVMWRLTTVHPAFPATMKAWEVRVSKLTHLALYALMLAMPLTGWALSSTSPYGISFFGLGQVPNLPVLPDLENKQEIGHAFGEVHETLALALAILVALHIAAALKHHFKERDDILLRMMPRFTEGFLRRMRKEA